MKKYILSLLLGLTILISGCENTNWTILPQGPKMTELLKAKDEQIATQSKQISDLQAVRESEWKEASRAASSVKGILKANEYVEPILPKEAIGAEAEVAQKRLPPDDPAETVRALERVMLIITGQRDEAQRKYAEVFKEIQLVREEIEKREQAIAQRDAEIKARDTQIAQLTQAAQAESEKHKNDVKNLIAQKEREKEELRKEYESRERAQWVLWTRIAGLVLIVIGALVMVVLKAFPEGGGLVGSGVVIGLVSIFIDWLTKQAFFPWMMGGILLTILIAGGYALYRVWKTKTLHAKTVAAIQDFKDEATIKGTDLWGKFEEHAKYRLGGRDSKWGKEQMKVVASLGLIDPKGEESLQAQTPKVDNPQDQSYNIEYNIL